MWGLAKNLVRSAENYISTANEQYEQTYTQTNDPAYGFRVIHVAQNSPASEAGLESLFDFIIGLNGHEIEQDQYNVAPYQPPTEAETTPRTSMQSGRSRSSSAAQPDFATPPTTAPVDTFLEEVNRCKGQSVSLEVWSAKGRVRRTVMLPVEDIPQQEEDDTNVGLGMTVQWTPLAVADHVWHVLNVSANSPAELAGLISHADYIVAAENGLLESGGESLLGRIVSRMVTSYQNDPPQPRDGPPPELELYVYNHDYDTLRPVRIRPNNNWGGTGLLGCGVGYGLLHRLPVVAGKYDNSPSSSSSANHRRRSSSIYQRDNNNHGLAPGGTLFEADEDTSAFITPANLPQSSPQAAPGPPPPPPPPSSSKRRQHPSSQPLSADMQSYFDEGEQRSKELEGNIKTGSGNSNVPPPPKAGEHKP